MKILRILTIIYPLAHDVAQMQGVIGPGAVIYIPKLLKEIAACNVSRDGLSIATMHDYF